LGSLVWLGGEQNAATVRHGIKAKWGQIKFQDTVFPVTQKQLRKFALTPLCAFPEDYKSKLASKRPVKSLCCKNPTQTRDHLSSDHETVTAPCYIFFIPSPFTTRRAGRMAL
jgi:hypothetical protein